MGLGIDQVVAMRPAATIGTIHQVTGTTASSRENRLIPPNGENAKGVWREIEIGELPKLAFCAVSIGQWIKIMGVMRMWYWTGTLQPKRAGSSTVAAVRSTMAEKINGQREPGG